MIFNLCFSAAKLERAVREKAEEKAEAAKKENAPVFEPSPVDVQPVIFDILEKSSAGSILQPGGHPDGFPKPMKLEGLSSCGPKPKVKP